MSHYLYRSLLAAVLLAAVGCTTSPPRNVDNVCAIFQEKNGWYRDAARSSDKWGSPIPVMMAIIHQESRFQADARPPRKTYLGIIPGPRPSSAYGYSQAKTGTWGDYKRDAGRFRAKRDDFGDSIDFVGWYNHQSRRRSGIAAHDTYALYLAYHEGHAGYNRATYLKKPWLMTVARRVEGKADTYQGQLQTCEQSLKRRRGFLRWF